MASVASSRVMPLTSFLSWVFLDQLQPLYQGMLAEASGMLPLSSVHLVASNDELLDTKGVGEQGVFAWTAREEGA